MAEVKKFEDYSKGCLGCVNLQFTVKGEYICSAHRYSDNSLIVPIRNGKKTEDFGACDGQSYVIFQRERKMMNYE